MLIFNCNLITWDRPNQILEDFAIYIQGGVIHETGSSQEMLLKYPSEEKVDAHSQYVLPGNICAHTHFYGAFARGLGIPGAAPADFPEILEKLWWALDKSLELKDVYNSAMVCIADAIRHGTTTLVDHHASPNAIGGSLDEIARAVTETGVRAALCYEVTDRDGLLRAEAGIAENVRFLRRIQDGDDAGGKLAGLFGLHAGLTLSDETLLRCRKAVSENVGFHVHVAEHEIDEYDSIEKSGLRVVDRLARHGVLGPDSVVGHAVHVDTKEIEILAQTGTWVSHQPRSNMNNGVGLPEVESMMRAGVRVCLGNDGFSNSMWDEMKTAYLAHKLIHLDPRRMGGYDVMEMAIYNNAALVSHLYQQKIGVIEKHAQADLIFVEYLPYTPMTVGNLPWHILFGFREDMVTATMVQGKFLMFDRKLLTIDEEKLAFEVRKTVPDVWERYAGMIN
jgi:putative selenium metabolism protein SsnA